MAWLTVPRWGRRRRIPRVLFLLLIFLFWFVYKRVLTVKGIGGAMIRRCKIPNLELNGPEVQEHFPTNREPLKCNQAVPWTEITNGKFVLLKEGAKCRCSYIFRQSDHKYAENSRDCANGSAIGSDFLAVECTDGQNATYRNYHAGIRVSELVHTRRENLGLVNDSSGKQELFQGIQVQLRQRTFSGFGWKFWLHIAMFSPWL